MSSNHLATKLLETIRPPITRGASIYAIAPFGRTFLSGMARLDVCAGSLSGALLTLAVLTILFGGDPGPTPAPTPIPF